MHTWEHNLTSSASFAVLYIFNPLQFLHAHIYIKCSSSWGGYRGDFWIVRSMSYEM